MASIFGCGCESSARWGALLFAAGLQLAGAAPVRGADATGTEFWLAFEENVSAGNLAVQILGPVGSTGSVAIASLAFQASFTIPATGSSTVGVPQAAMLTSGDGTTNLAVEITSDRPVVVYGLDVHVDSSDSLLALPLPVLGLHYLVTTYAPGFFESQFAIVATVDGTSVDVIPSATVGSHPPGVTYAVLLARGEAYQAQSTGDLSGTEISATAPIGVFAGNSCANVPVGVGYCDHLAEQLLPVAAWGAEVVVVPSATRTAPERVRLHSAQDGTSLTTYPPGLGIPSSMNHNQVSEHSVSGPFAVLSQDAGHAISVARFAEGTAADSQPGDPFELIELPTSRFAYGYRIATADDGAIFPINYVNVVAPNAAVGRIRLDGIPISAGCFAAIGASAYSACRQSIAPGAHRLGGPIAFGASVYGFGASVSYGSPAGGDSLPFVDGFEDGDSLAWSLTTP